ncbi:sensor histidine kinase [Ramlibacter sp. MAHUQ-53]|uniref:sensor histidine kinase n=1 Tax=unclassified Ramlibacter TaxID=2617605 RepID=UPI00362C65A6
MLLGLRRRLLIMIIGPLLALALLNAWFEYESADNVAELQDQRMAELLPLLADSVIPSPSGGEHASVLLLVPAVEQFLEARRNTSAYAVIDADGRVMHGSAWLAGLPLASSGTEFHSEPYAGVNWRIARERQQTVVGEVVVALADGSNPQQQWLRSILFKVLLPHLFMVAAAAFTVRWAVDWALRPLLALTDVVTRRSPHDLSPIDDQFSPVEVRPMVAALNRLLGLVDAQAESQRRFIADAAHQLRTPLAGLQAQVEAWAQAARRIAPPGGPGTMLLPVEQIEKLRGATRRTSQLANQLLALSRADSRVMAAQPMQPVELKALCESILEAHLDAASAKSLDLGLEAAPCSVPGHEWLLRELLANLVDNAVKYTPPGGTVTIRCAPVGRGASLEVADDGPGVPAQEMPHLMQRFYRVPGTPGEGNGLGLAIAQEIARVHRSQLRLHQGAGGRGLKVSLLLPG